MNFEKFTERARGFVQAAQALALREGHQQFTPEHLLKVLLDDKRRAWRPGSSTGRVDASARGPDGRRNWRSSKLPKVAGLRRGPGLSRPGHGTRSSTSAEKIAREGGRQFLRHRRAAAARPRAWTSSTDSAPASSPMPVVTPQVLNSRHRGSAQGPHRRQCARRREWQYDALKKYARDLTEAARNGQARSR